MATKFEKLLLAFQIIGRIFKALARILSGKKKNDEPAKE